MFLSQQLKRKMIIANRNAKYDLTDELPSNVRLQKMSKLHEVIV